MGRNGGPLRGIELTDELTRVFVSQINRACMEGFDRDEDILLAYQAHRVTDALRDYFKPGRWGYQIYCCVVSGPIFELYVDIAPKDVEVSQVPNSLMLH